MAELEDKQNALVADKVKKEENKHQRERIGCRICLEFISNFYKVFSALSQHVHIPLL